MTVGGNGVLHTIGTVSRLTGVSAATVRVWEREGLLPARIGTLVDVHDVEAHGVAVETEQGLGVTGGQEDGVDPVEHQ